MSNFVRRVLMRLLPLAALLAFTADAALISISAGNGANPPAGGGGEPTISSLGGSTTHGEDLVINGNNFGVHADYGGASPFLVVAYQDFATTLEGNGWVQDGFDPENTNRSTSSPMGGAIIAHYRKTNEGSGQQGSIEVNIGSNFTGIYHVTFQYRESDSSPVLGWNACSKFFRRYLGSDGNGENWYLGPSWENATNYVTPPASLNRWTQHPTEIYFPQNTWRRFESIEFLGAGAGDGTAIFGSADFLRIALSGVEAIRRGTGLPDNPQPGQGTDANDNQQWVGVPVAGQEGGDIKLGSHLCDGEAAGAFFDFAEALVDYTLATPYVCHESTWAACTDAVYVQPPKAWSNTQITVQANRGTFADLPGEYLYIRNADNEVNANGFLIP